MNSEESVRQLLAHTVAVMREGGVADEGLGAFRSGTRLRKSLIRPVGRAWRLGVLLLGAHGELYSTGTVTRAIDPPRGTANKSPEAEQRREFRRAAVRGGFTLGEVVNFGYLSVPIDEAALQAGNGVLLADAGEVKVRWGQSGLAPLGNYLSDRADLLRDR